MAERKTANGPGSIDEALKGVQRLRARGRRRPEVESESVVHETRSEPGGGREPDDELAGPDVASSAPEEGKTIGTLRDSERQPEDWQTRVDDRLDVHRTVIRSDVKSNFTDFRNQMIRWAVGLLVGTLIAVWQMGDSWRESIQNSLSDFREEVRMNINRLERDAEQRDAQISELEDRTDNLPQ